MFSTIPLHEFRVLLLDMNSTFMFGEDRFGGSEDFGATYRAVGGRTLRSSEVNRAIRAAFAFLEERYVDPTYEDNFSSLAEAFTAAAGIHAESELALLVATFSRHECGVVPPEYAAALRALSATHELRLLTNIWAPKAAWIEELARCEVLPLFRRAVFSSDSRSVKPSLRLVREVLDGISCEARLVLMIGDSIQRDLVAGRRAGLTTAWVAPAAEVPPEAVDLADYHVPSLLALAGHHI